MRVILPALVVAICGLAAVPAIRAQTLADVAKKEEDRRKEIKQPSKVYTNKDLRPVPPPATPPAAAAPAAEVPASEAAAGKEDKDGKDGKAGEKRPVKDQAYWSGRLKDLQTQLDRDQVYADALQSRINGLTADFSARDDPAQRDAIGRDRQRALLELDRLKQTIQTDKTAITDLEEEARRAAVPPGWLR